MKQAATPKARVRVRRSRRRGRWRRRLLALALILLAIGGALRLTRAPERIVAAVASRALGADVSVRRVQWRWPWKFALLDVAATLHGATSPFARVATVEADVSLFPPAVEDVRAQDATVVLKERPDGTFALPVPPPRAESSGPLPHALLTRGRVDLEGSGPLHQRLAELLADKVPRTLEIETLELRPAADGRFDLVGGVVAAGAVRLRVLLSGTTRRLERVTARVTESRPIDLAALAAETAPPIADALTANALTGTLAGDARVVFGEGAPTFEADVDLLDVALTPQNFPTRVEGLRGRLEFRGSSLHVPGLLGRHPPGAVRISGDVTDLGGENVAHLVVRIDSAVADPPLLAALSRDRIGKMVVEALEPEGRFSVTADVDCRRGAIPHVKLDLELEDNALTFQGFLDETGRRHGLAMRVEQIRGKIAASNEESHYDRVTGFTRGGARVESSAKITVEHVHGTVSAYDAPIDEELLASAEKEVGPVVRDVARFLGLKGTFDALARFDLRGDDFQLTIEAHPKSVDLLPERFPYALHCDGGALLLEKDRVRFDDLVGGAGDLNLRVRGFVGIAGEEPPLDLTIEAHDLPLDEKLMAAVRTLPDRRLVATIERLKPEGHVDLKLSWRRAQAHAPLELSILVVPEGVKLEVLEGAAVVSDLRGEIRLSRTGDGPWQLAFEQGGVSARAVGGDFVLTGAISEAEGSTSTLRLLGHRVRIDDHFVAMVRALSPDFADLIASNKVRGRLGVDCDLVGRGGHLEPTRVDIVPDVAPAGDENDDVPDEGIAAAPPWLPLPLLWTSGSMHADVEEGTLDFDRLGGRVGSAALEATGGLIRFSDDGLEAEVGLLADGLTFAETTELILGEEKRAALSPYGPIGRTRARVQTLSFHLSHGSQSVDRVDVEKGSVVLDGWALYTAGALKELSGTLLLDSLHYADAGHGIADVAADGQVLGMTVDVGGLRFSNVQSDLLLDHGKLSVPWLSADFAGGRLPRDRNRVSLTLLGDMPFEGRLALLAGDVSRVLGDDSPRTRGLSGRLDAEAGFRGRGRSLLRGQGLTSLEAAGSVGIENAKLWVIPLFNSLYSKAIVPLTGASSGETKSEPPKWERGRFEFALQGVYFHLSRIELEGEPLVLRGDGVLGPDALSMHLYPEVKAGVGWIRSIPLLGPIVGFILDLVEHQFGAFRFHGPYGNPEVSWDPVTLGSSSDLAHSLERPRTSPARDEARPARF